MDEYTFSPDSCAMEQPSTSAPAAPQTPAGPDLSAAPEVTPAPDPIPEEPTVPVRKPPRNGLWMTVAIIAICISLVLGGYAVWAAKNSAISFGSPVPDIPQSVTPSYNYRTDVSEEDKLTDQEIIKKLTPSVVTIAVRISSQGQTVNGLGTGIIYTDNGYILTNAHVVEDAVSISVTDHEGKEFPAKLIGADTASDTAVIKIEEKDLIPAEFGESSKLVPGDRVIAIGTPYSATLAYTATEGMVSALRYDMNFSTGYTYDLIQHDAAINSGNSGGPLVNVYGQVVGINTIKISGTYENLGFALQIDQVLPIAEELMEHGKIVRPGIGITGATYDADGVQGVYIDSVVPGGPADTAGLKRGDIIVKAGDTDVTTIEGLKEVINSLKIGDTLHVTYRRNNKVSTADLVLGELNAN